jgi:hypothetical protein
MPEFPRFGAPLEVATRLLEALVHATGLIGLQPLPEAGHAELEQGLVARVRDGGQLLQDLLQRRVRPVRHGDARHLGRLAREVGVQVA